MLTRPTNLPTSSRRPAHRAILRRSWIAAIALLAFAATGSAPAWGQGNILTPLDQIVPLDQLSTPTDDLVRLSTTYADALRELKVAQLSINTVQKLRPNAIVTNLEVQIAQLNLEAAQRKVNILRAIVEKQLKASEDKLEIARYLESIDDQGNANKNNRSMHSYMRVQDEATIEILKMILAMK